MADMEVINNRENEVEFIINRWIIDFYYSQGIEFFQNDKNEEFLSIKRVFESVLKRPYEVSSNTQIQIQLLQFLDQVIESESFAEPVDRINGLESALGLLEKINHDFKIQQEDYNSVKSSLQELIVAILVKSGEFRKAEEMVKKHFPRPMVGKKAIFMGLIKKKSKSHAIIDQVDFQRFKQEMVAFCQKIHPMKRPFLCKVGAACINIRLANPGDTTSDYEEACDPSPYFDQEQNTSAAFPPRELSPVTVSRLEAAYMSLATGLHDKSFTQLKKEVSKEDLTLTLQKCTSQEAEQVSSQAASCSPMEASSADGPAHVDADPQIQTKSVSETAPVTGKRQLYTVAQLVVEPDSQGSSQCTPASEEMDTEVRAEELTAAVASPARTMSQSLITEDKIVTPTRIRRRFRRGKTRRLSDSEEEDSASSLSTLVKRGKQANKDSNDQTSPISSPAKQTPPQSPASDGCDENDAQKLRIIDSSLDSSPGSPPALPVPQKSSTPHNDHQQKAPESKWKQLYNNAKESKETWDDDLYAFPRKDGGSKFDNESSSSNRRRMWTEIETHKLIEGVRKFGEGNWSKIRAYYSFNDRTNVNLKDRWRTLKKIKLV